jgi:hypothetical protein
MDADREVMISRVIIGRKDYFGKRFKDRRHPAVQSDPVALLTGGQLLH